MFRVLRLQFFAQVVLGDLCGRSVLFARCRDRARTWYAFQKVVNLARIGPGKLARGDRKSS